MEFSLTAFFVVTAIMGAISKTLDKTTDPETLYSLAMCEVRLLHGNAKLAQICKSEIEGFAKAHTDIKAKCVVSKMKEAFADVDLALEQAVPST